MQKQEISKNMLYVADCPRMQNTKILTLILKYDSKSSQNIYLGHSVGLYGIENSTRHSLT